jgi:hypothetical protein
VEKTKGEDNMKTYKDWKGSLHKYLDIFDLVDEEMVNHFTNVLPPATFRRDLIQLGEPFDHINGQAVYPTLMKTAEGWRYAGNCYLGTKKREVVPVQYRNYYRVIDAGSYCEVLFIVETNQDETLVCQKEGMYDSIEDAKYLVEYLESINADIEYIVHGTYTG